MGILKALNTSELLYLKPVHIFGRDPAVADVVLQGQSCSRMHCVIRWQSGLWQLVDESKNGCFINEQRVEKGRSTTLNQGDIFSAGSEPSARWVVESDGPPQPLLISLDGQEVIPLQTLNILPNEESPECQIVQQGHDWFFEQGHDYHPISEGFQLMIGDREWVFRSNQILDETELGARVGQGTPGLIFDVSRNEEHINLIFESNNVQFDLDHKSYHYLLLEMARYFAADTSDDLKQRGWMSNDLLLHNLQIDINHLNIQIYRARQALRVCSSYWGQNLIERRRGEIRLHPCHILIRKESDTIRYEP